MKATDGLRVQDGRTRTPSVSLQLCVQTKGVWWLLLLGTAVLLFTACGGGQNLEEPPDIRYGEDLCEECSMIISEPRHAASYVLADGTVRRFDDIGDMLAFDAAHHEEVHVYWVHDYHTEEWLMTSHASFVLSGSQDSPMGWGVLAFADKAAAEHYAAADGGTLTGWVDLQTAVAAGELDPGDRSAHNHPQEDMSHEGMDHDNMNHHDQDAGG